MEAMDEDTSELYMQKIQEYVLDEGKIVTYKWLSRDLNLHVNLSKQLLNTFVTQHENVVHTTYFLSGLLKDEVTYKVLVVKKDDLEKTKSKFKKLSSEHVYSVQKAKQITDLNSLYIMDRYKDNSDITRLNTISCNEAVERAADEIARLKINARAASSTTDARAWPAVTKKVTTDVNKETDTATTSDEKAETKKEETAKKKDKKNGGIAAMFAAQSSKIKKQEMIVEKSKSNDKPVQNSKRGIAVFFNKNAVKEHEKSKQVKLVIVEDESDENKLKERVIDENKVNTKGKCKPEPVQKTKKVNSSSGRSKTEGKSSDDSASTKGKSIVCASDSEDADNEPVQKGKKTNSVKHSSAKAKAKRKASDDPTSSKKRKRIMCVSDSEDSDSDIFGKDYDDDNDISGKGYDSAVVEDLFTDDTEAQNFPLQLSPPKFTAERLVESGEEVIPPTPQGGKTPRRKRERKLKVSTFMDEDGYMVTKKEYVVESCTDSEGEEKEKNMKTEENNSKKGKDEKSPTSEPSAKKKCSPQKVKQATLMSFFKKK